MTFCWTDRSLSCSPMIREASSCSRWEQTQRPTARRYTARVREVSIKSLPLWAQRTLWKRRWKEFKSQWGVGTTKKHSLLSIEPMHIYTQRRCAWGLQESEPVRSQRWKKWPHIPISSPDISPVDSHLWMKNEFSPRESHQRNKLLLSIGYMLHSRWSAESKLRGIFWGSCLIMSCRGF